MTPNPVRPQRLRLSRKKGFNLQWLSRETNGLECVNVARPGKWGNQWRVGDDWFDERGRKIKGGMTAEEAVRRHRRSLMHDGVASAEIARELRGKNVACWCGLDQPCHGDTYLELANTPVLSTGGKT